MEKMALMVPLAAGAQTWHTAFNIARCMVDLVWSAGKVNIKGGNSKKATS